MATLFWMLGVLILGLVVTVRADAVVTGTVFCDQCRDGDRSLLDYPLYGAKVAITCDGGSAYKEETTNWFGTYSVRFEGSPDLAGCSARVVDGPDRCGAAAGPAQGLKLAFGMFGLEMYTVDPLLSLPAEPMSFCGYRGPGMPPSPNKPAPRLPPGLPGLPPPARGWKPPPLPVLDASACTYDKWMMPEFKCYWKLVSPGTKVALAFGPVAAGKYGTDMTLWEGLEGRGDVYRTLLREGTTALLNSYNSLGFSYPTLSVIDHMNHALLGSSHDAVMVALRFKRENWGSPSPLAARVSCNLSPCS